MDSAVRRVGFVGLLACAASLLAPSPADAQSPPLIPDTSALTTTTPGPCDDGWVAPTPTAVPVTSVPITVTSTVDDYFVLYVTHERRSGTFIDVAVSVTLGEPGTTTLSDNLAPVSADKYQVEKYSVASPADVDGDCIDDITELNDLGNLNPINPATEMVLTTGSTAIDSHATFEELSYKGKQVLIDYHLEDLEFVKFWLLHMEDGTPEVYFMNTEVHRWHGSFSRRMGWSWAKRAGHMRGEIVYHPNVVAPDGSLGVYRYEFEPSDRFNFEDVAYSYEVLAAAMPVLENNLLYYPMPGSLNLYKNQKAKYDASRVNILLAEDVMSDAKYIPFNEAEGYGLLREIGSGEVPGARDVVILKALPNDLPRVAGIVTTVPQTPLSHVNLRAIQNGVPNAFIRGALDDDDIDDLLDSHVYYKVATDGYTLRAATKAEVDAYHNSTRPAVSQTPQRDLSVQAITSLDDVEFDDWDAFGVKAANVAELSGLAALADGVAPDGFAVPFYFYDEFMKQATLAEETILGKKKAPAPEKVTLAAGTTLAAAVPAMLANSHFQTDFDAQEEMLDDLRKAIKNATTPAWIITALEDMHASYPVGTSLRYRSSTNNEDLPDFNGAGLYDSKTQDPDETADDGIDKSIKGVWASLWNFRAFLEREHHRIDHTAAAMGVLVHPNYSGELANGVAVSFDPVTGVDDHYYVNTQIGEDLVTNPDPNSAPEQLLLDSAGKATVLARSNLAPSSELLMSDAQMVQLRNSLKAVHDHFETLYEVADGDDFAMEIEFKITADDKLAIKQARPWVFNEPLSLPPVVTVAFDNVEATEGTPLSLTLTRVAGIHADPLTIDLTWTETGDTFDGTPPAQVTFPANQATVTVSVPTADDTDGETDSTVTAALAPSSDYDNGNPATATATVTDNDLPAVAVSADGDVTEGAAAGFTVSAVPVPAADLPVTVTITADGDYGVVTGSRTVTVPTGGSVTLTIGTSDDSVDELDGSVTVTVVAGSGYTVSNTHGTGTVAVADNDATVPVLDAQLEADVRSYAAEVHYGVLHVTRWKRVLVAFGLEDYAGLVPTTLDEARVHVDIGRPRWVPVFVHMVALDAVNPQPPPARGSVQVDAQVLANARSKAAETHRGVKHVNRWKRVLEAFGDGDYPGKPLTAAGAQLYANVWSGWDQVVAQLRLIEAATVTDPPPVPVVVPVVSILSSAGGTEGATVSFTLTAGPAPAADLDVDVSVVTSGDFGYGPVPATVTIPTGGTATVTIATTGDSTDEPDGTVILTIDAGSGYTVGANASGSVDVTDDDDPVAPVVIPDPQVSITAGPGVTEGGAASFTLTAVPAPTADLPVTVTVSQSGAFGAPTGSRTVTVPSGGSVSFTVATTDDSADETDGSVTVTVNTGSGYTVSNTQGAGTVAVSDDDDPPIPVVSITAGPGVTEGGAASFTLTAAPAPASDLPVTVTVGADGDYGAVTGSRTVTVPTTGSVTLSVATSDDSVDESDGSVTVTVNAGGGYTVSNTQGTGTVTVADDDAAPTGPVLGAQLEADVRSYAAEVHHGVLHVTRWKRVLEAFGLEDYAGLVPTTLDEARVHVDIGRPRWVPVLAHMVALDAVNPQPPPARGSVQVDAQVLATARSKAAETHGGAKHVNRWKRVLEAFSDGDYPNIEPLTAAGAQVYANVWSAWDGVAAQLRLIEAATVTDPPPVPVVVPVVSILSSAGGTEGATVSFTLTAGPAPAADLDVDVSVVTSGDFGYGPVPATVTIPTGGTATVTIATSDDSTDEPDGTVTLTIDAGSGYTVGANASGSVDVTDDDDPVAPVVIPDPVVSITAGPGVTEGAGASFTLTAAPAPAADLPVTVTITQNGDYGAATGSRTVTVPSGGSVSFTVATTDDSTDELDGSVTVTVNTGSGYTVSNTHGTGTVNVSDDDDPPIPVVSITAGPGVTEGTNASFTLTAVPAPAADLPVTVTVSQSGAFGAATGSRTVTVPSGGSVSFTVATTDDSTDETDGSVTVTVNTGSGYTVSNTQGTGTVAVSDDDDPPIPVVSITAGPGVTEGTSALFTLTAVPAPAADLPVTVTVSQSGAFGAATGSRTVTVPTTGSVTLTIGTSDDSVDELDGSVTVTVNTGGGGYTVSNTQGAGTVAVADNDVPQVSITAGPGVTEGTNALFTLTAAPAPAADLPVTVTITQNGAFGAATGSRTVTVPSGGSVSFTVATTDDSTDETDGSVTVTVNTGSGYTVSNTQGTGTVAVSDNDDPPIPQVSITAGPGVTEGTNALFTLTAVPAPAADLPVTVTVSQSGAFGAATGSRTVTVPSGGSVSFTVATTDDSADELDGSVTVTVNTGSGYTVSNTQGTGTVAVADNDDPPPSSSVTVSVADASGYEASWAVDFTVTLSEASTEEVRVRFMTWNWSGRTGRAKIGLDYYTTERTVVFAPGQTEQTVSVWIIDDNRSEPDEYFTVELTNPQGATIEQDHSTATGTITDDD